MTGAPDGRAAEAQAASSPEAPLLGRDGLPIRVFGFAGGGFDTIRQLGVAHALLVIQGKAPDAVVGVSAGAVNAAALAEILQAGGVVKSQQLDERESLIESQRHRVAKLRQVLAVYQRAPGEILGESKLDALQIEGQRPLQPLMFPVNERTERDERSRMVAARAGLINLYNQLLETRLTIGTITRAVRRILGIRASKEIRSKPGRWIAKGMEFGRLWLLLGANLYNASPLLWPLVRPLFPAAPSRRQARKGSGLSVGVTAANLIFRPPWWSFLSRKVRHWSAFIVMLFVWSAVTYLALGLPYVLAHTFTNIFRGDTSLVALKLYAGSMVLLVLLLGTPWWRELLDFNRSATWRLLGDVLFEVVGLAFFLAYWLSLFAAIWADVYLILTLPRRDDIVFAGDALVLLRDAWRSGWIYFQKYGWAVPPLLAGVSYLLYKRLSRTRDYLRDLLAQYELADGLLNEHPLRTLLVQLFDPCYYGVRDMGQILERTLNDEVEPSEQHGPQKRVRDYAHRDPPVQVGLAVADVESGTLQCITDDVTVVEGLIAATSVVPLFRPTVLDGHVYVDGINIANDPTRPLLEFVRSRVNPNAKIVHLYSVAALPFTRTALQGKAPEPDNLLDVVWRAKQLERFRDATLERRLTELYTMSIPKGKVAIDVPPADAFGKPVAGQPADRFLRVWVTPVEPDQAMEVNRRLLEADKEQRQQLVAETVADGCRTALEMMLAAELDIDVPDVTNTADRRSEKPPERRSVKVLEEGGAVRTVEIPVLGNRPVIRCRQAVAHYLNRRDSEAGFALPRDLPGSDNQGGPGVVDICSRCAIGRSEEPDALPSRVRSLRIRSQLVARDDVLQPSLVGPVWPHQLVREKPTADDPHFVEVPGAEERRQTQEAFPDDPEDRLPWPVARENRDPVDPMRRPLVSLLFSGGVFRGVYQMGVLNALSEARVKPDLVAGASIGSITAAMVARALSEQAQEGQRYLIARLSATYLAVDRLVLTDRFADFVREVTLRAASTEFSLREADQLMRRFDNSSLEHFSHDARRVIAGIERLVYVSPFELHDLVRAFRHGKTGDVITQLRNHSQEWLDRMKVGTQILGAEPLAMLIEEFVLDQAVHAFGGVMGVPFDYFLAKERGGLCFLATTTNLTQGRLEVLGNEQLQRSARRATLLSGLLSSSAFPGVFRPRGSWELMPEGDAQDHYIDGGVMDNLPLDAVAKFLHSAARSGIVANRPMGKSGPVPHMLFSASLQEKVRPLGDEVNRVADNWLAITRRAKRLGYNQKLDIYAKTQSDLTRIWDARQRDTPQKAWSAMNTPQRRTSWEPMHLHVATVRPDWLCGTFAFHPMLGFRRHKQAMSIAHGCATTLLALGRLNKERPEWIEAWGIDGDRLPEDPPQEGSPIIPDPEAGGKGNCWFRPRIPCPFSSGMLKEVSALPDHQPLGPRTLVELETIYRRCGQAATHAARENGDADE